MPLTRGRCRLRELLGDMSPAEFARRMGIHESSVSRWLKDERAMTYEHSVEAAGILGCHAEDLYLWIYTSPKSKR